MKTCYVCGRVGTQQFSEFFNGELVFVGHRCSWRPACQERVDRTNRRAKRKS